MAGKPFGSIRKLPSGRYQGTYPDGGRRVALPVTYTRKGDARNALDVISADRQRGTWRDPRAGRETFGAYAERWLESGGSRGHLAPRTAALYRDLLHAHLDAMTEVPLGAIRKADVREWHSAALKAAAERAGTRGTGATQVRQAYALLRAIMSTAVRDELIPSNPCAVVGAGTASAPERPRMAPEELRALLDALPAHLRPVIMTAAVTGARAGELSGLQVRDFNPKGATITIERQRERDGVTLSPTKTGDRRVIDLPEQVVRVLRTHVASLPDTPPTAPLFRNEGGGPLTYPALTQGWSKARRTTGLGQYRIHDLRHLALSTLADAGASWAVIKAWGGHRTDAAARAYQHAAQRRDPRLAAHLGAALFDVAPASDVARSLHDDA